ncbi:rCG22216 [Rattus norvegicus]|uniref:RCG22216 n=1 Tax=Rattus norvegicus TaxID=10116 RepID=A6IPJ0_RAT|nr:rCG22216 [Rattus norvegicus]
MCVHATYVCLRQKRVLCPLELELQTAVSRHIGAGSSPGSSAKVQRQL